MMDDDNDYTERLRTAASTHVEQEVATYPDLESSKLMCLLLEKAFIQGASWYNLIVQQRMTTQLTELKSELREVSTRANS